MLVECYTNMYVFACFYQTQEIQIYTRSFIQTESQVQMYDRARLTG